MRTIVFLFIFCAIVLIALSIGLELMKINSQVNVERAQQIISDVSTIAWNFASPLLQLIIVVLIIQWILAKSDVKISLRDLPASNVQVFIAVLVIGTFCVSALGNLPGMTYTKDLALIVIGFYFGTRAKNANDQSNVADTEVSPPQTNGDVERH